MNQIHWNKDPLEPHSPAFKDWEDWECSLYFTGRTVQLFFLCFFFRKQNDTSRHFYVTSMLSFTCLLGWPFLVVKSSEIPPSFLSLEWLWSQLNKGNKKGINFLWCAFLRKSFYDQFTKHVAKASGVKRMRKNIKTYVRDTLTNTHTAWRWERNQTETEEW